MNVRDWPRLPLLLIAAMFLFGIALYPRLGEQIPMHWNAMGQIDRWEPKSVTTVFMLPFITVGLYLLLVVMPYFDPRRRNLLASKKPYTVVLDGVTALMAMVFFMTLVTAMGVRLPVDRIIMLGTSLMFIVLGHYMGRVKQNWTMGVRLSWTLADEVVWGKTNRLGGRLFMAAGFIGIVGAFLPAPWHVLAIVVPALAMLPVLYVYSMLEYRRRHPDEMGLPGGPAE